MLMLCSSGYAQYSNLYYHIVGDTIMQTPNNGYLPFWGFYNTISDGMPIFDGSCNGTYAQEFYTSTPIRILGVAAAIESWTTQPPITRVDTTYLPEYFKIYQGFGKDGQPIEVASVEWRDLSNRRYLHLDGNFDNIVNYSNPCFTGIGGLDTTQCCCVGAKSKTFWLNEFYLDNAITIVDTFYVGIVINNTVYIPNLDPADYRTTTRCAMIATSSASPHCGGTPCILCTNNFLQYSYFDSAFYRVPGNFVLIMYPIIELDTTVPPQDYCPDTIANLVIQPTSATCLAATCHPLHQRIHRLQHRHRCRTIRHTPARHLRQRWRHYRMDQPDMDLDPQHGHRLGLRRRLDHLDQPQPGHLHRPCVGPVQHNATRRVQCPRRARLHKPSSHPHRRH